MKRMEQQLVIGFADANDATTVGGKAYALAQMVRAGFVIPGGFVLSSHAFRMMTPALQTSVFNAFDELKTDFVAVRSSAINEDGASASWAGQLDTFLNITRDTLLEHIEACWESASSPRTLAYAQQTSTHSGKVAVIVQKMIQSEVSGVAFSVHPVLNDDSKLIIEAGFGLGEAIVSGEVAPDTYIVSKKGQRIADTHIARQTKKLIQDSAGKTVWQDMQADGVRQKLGDEHILQLSDVVVRLENFFGHPVDVEWALHENTLYVLQCRPITSIAG